MHVSRIELDLKGVARLGGFYKDGPVGGVSIREVESEDFGAVEEAANW